MIDFFLVQMPRSVDQKPLEFKIIDAVVIYIKMMIVHQKDRKKSTYKKKVCQDAILSYKTIDNCQ